MLSLVMKNLCYKNKIVISKLDSFCNKVPSDDTTIFLTIYTSSTNHKTPDQLKIQSCAVIGWKKSVDGQNLVVPSYTGATEGT